MTTNPDPQPAALYQDLVEQAADAIIFADRDGVIRIWNRGAATIFGYPASEALGQRLDLIIPERFRAAHWAGFDRALATGETKYAGRALTTRSTHKDGRKLYVDMTFIVVKDAGGAVVGSAAIARESTTRPTAAQPAS